MTGRVLSDVLGELDSRDGLSGVRLDRVTVGPSVVLVELVAGVATRNDKRFAGLAHTPAGAASTAAAHDLETVLAPIRDSAAETRDGSTEGSIDRAIAVAAVNALSSPYLARDRGDPMALLSSSVGIIATVGLFAPAFRKFTDVEVRVIEREPARTVEPPDGVAVEQFEPTEARTAMRDAEVVFVTGSTLVYGGLETYLAVAPASSTLVVVGATASFLPEPLFDRGVDIVAGATVSDPDRARRAVESGACGTELHDEGVQKVYTALEPSTNIDLT